MGREEAFRDRVWFNWQQPASPLLLGATVDACGQPFREFFGFPFFTSIVYYRTLDRGRGYQASWLLRVKEGEACGRLLVDALSVPSFRARMDHVLDERFGAMMAAASEFADLSLKEFDDEALCESFTRFHRVFVDFYSLGAITEPVQWHVEQVIRDFLAEDAGRLPEGWPAERVEAAAFAMSEEPYTLAIERSLVEVAEAFDAANEIRDRDARSLEAMGDREWGRLWERQPGLWEVALAHAEDYFWKTNNYRGTHVVRPHEVVLEVARSANGRAAAGELRARIEGTERRRREMEADRARLLPLAPGTVRTAVHIGDRYGASLADRRKATMLRALHGMDLLGREVARRTSVPYEMVALLTPAEVPEFLTTPGSYDQRLTAREEAVVLVQSPFPLDDAEMAARLRIGNADGETAGIPRKDDVSLAEGGAALDALNRLDANLGLFQEDDSTGVARGEVIVRPSSASVVEGICRVITDPRTETLGNGEILVATSTTPDFMPAIRHAGALLVDQGGVLSHAALTSRELGTPCIVGASVATALFRSGDRLRLDFDKGTATLAEERVTSDA